MTFVVTNPKIPSAEINNLKEITELSLKFLKEYVLLIFEIFEIVYSPLTWQWNCVQQVQFP